MKKFPLIAILCLSIVSAIGIEIYRAHKAKERDSAEWRQIGDNLGESLRETKDLLDTMPKIDR